MSKNGILVETKLAQSKADRSFYQRVEWFDFLLQLSLYEEAVIRIYYLFSNSNLIDL